MLFGTHNIFAVGISLCTYGFRLYFPFVYHTGFSRLVSEIFIMQEMQPMTVMPSEQVTCLDVISTLTVVL